MKCPVGCGDKQLPTEMMKVLNFAKNIGRKRKKKSKNTREEKKDRSKEESVSPPRVLFVH